MQMGAKPFLTYEQLVAKLRDEKHLSIPPEEEAHVVQLLKEHSYFALISGYKMLFKGPDGSYLPDTRVDDIFALYRFDDRLRDIFFFSILIIEKHIKSLLSYAFVEKYGDEQWRYMDPSSYDSGDNREKKREIKKLISTFTYAVTPPSDQAYIAHQWDHYHNVPLWAAMKTMTFGSVSKMYSLCPQSVRMAVSEEFPEVNESQLAAMLDILSRVRNVCAHNERLYDFKSRSRRVPDMPVHGELGIPKSGAAYRKGKDDLFGALICLRYLLDSSHFRDVVMDISNELDHLHELTPILPPTKILSCMGFPEDWKRIAP